KTGPAPLSNLAATLTLPGLYSSSETVQPSDRKCVARKFAASRSCPGGFSVLNATSRARFAFMRLMSGLLITSFQVDFTGAPSLLNAIQIVRMNGTTQTLTLPGYKMQEHRT